MSACSVSILTLNLVLTLGIPPNVHGGVHIFLPTPHTIRSVLSLSGHATAYRWRSLPRVRWHRASSPQGSSSNGCCLCITMDQMLLCSSLFPCLLLVYSECVQIIGCISTYKYCCTVLWNRFTLPTYGLYKCKESSVHGTISSVVCQNIISSVMLLYYGPVFSPTTYVCTRVKSSVYTAQYHHICWISKHSYYCCTVDPFPPSRLLSVHV